MENNDIAVQDTGATQSDAPAVNVDNRTEDQMFADILRRSPIMDEAAGSLSNEGQDIPAPEGTNEDDDLEVPTVSDEVVDVPSDNDDAVEDEQASTQNAVYELDDLDEFSVNIKIDGETVPVSLQELVKGYATDQSLSKKGRELGDARKQLETERESKIKEIDNVLGAASRILMNSENTLAEEFHGYDEKITEAREDGDTYLVQELKDKKEQAQDKYWAARNEREAMIKQADAQKKELEGQQFNERAQSFSQEIVKTIPDWSEDVAGDIREFVLNRGIPEEYLPQMMDVNIIKFIDDFRRSEQARSTGAKKRHEAKPVKAAPPMKQDIAGKKAAAVQANRSRVFSGDASKEEQDNFLKNLAARHFN